MMLFKVLKKKTIRWNGDPKTGNYYGWGDYRDTVWEEVGVVESPSEKDARKEARKIFKSLGYKCYFSRTGINCLLEEVKNENNC